MKITLSEDAGSFGIKLSADTVADAAMLVRFGSNATNQIMSLATVANADDTIISWVVLGKHRRASSAVTRRGGRRR